MMTQLFEDLQWHSEGQALSWTRIEPMCNGVKDALRVSRQIRALGHVLAQQPVGVLVRAALKGLRGSARKM